MHVLARAYSIGWAFCSESDLPIRLETSAEGTAVIPLDEQNALLSACSDDLSNCLISTGLGLPAGRSVLDPDRLGEAYEIVSELRQDLWDLDPSLIETSAAPTFARDLEKRVCALETDQRSRIREDLLRVLCGYLPEVEVERVMNTESEGKRTEIVRAWWNAQGPEFMPFEKIERELREKRRWRRMHAANELRELGGPDLVDVNTGDIDEEALERWSRSRRRQPTLVP